MWYEKSVSTATHPYASPWWSWPLMLRPVAYWQNFPAQGDVATIWGAGNPILWWGVIPAMTITAVRAIERPNLDAHLSRDWLSRELCDLDPDRPHTLPLPLYAVGLYRLSGARRNTGRLLARRLRVLGSLRVLLASMPAFAVGLGHMAVALKFEFALGATSRRRRTALRFVVVLRMDSAAAISRSSAAAMSALRFSPARSPSSSTTCRYGSALPISARAITRGCGSKGRDCAIGSDHDGARKGAGSAPASRCGPFGGAIAAVTWP